MAISQGQVTPSIMRNGELSMRPNTIDWIALVLSIIGLLNWGLMELFHVNLVVALFGPVSTLSLMVYVLVGLSGLWLIYSASRA